MKSYEIRSILFPSLFLSLGLSFFFVFFLSNTVREMNLLATFKEMRQLVVALSPQLSKTVPSNKKADFQVQLDRISAAYHAKFGVYLLDGTPFYLPPTPSNLPDRLSVHQRNAILSAGFTTLKTKKSHSKVIMRAAFPFVRDSNIEGFFLVDRSLNPTENLSFLIFPKVLQFFLPVFLILFLFIFAFYRQIHSPIVQILRVFNKVSKNGKYGQQTLDTRLKLKPPAFQHLAASFNRMMDHLEDQIDYLKSEKQELLSVFSVMTEVLWIVDHENRILFANRAFYALTQSGGVEGEFYWKFIRNNELDNLIKTVRKQRKRKIMEIHQDQSTYLCTADFLPQEKKIIIVLNDISEIKEVESYKRHLVMNVSHELKTPLTSIRGFVETLLIEEKDENKLHYLKIILRNSERLSNIIQDLLLLSNLETSAEPLQTEKSNLTQLIRNLLPLFEEKLRAKNLKLELNLQPDVWLEIDGFKIEQVLVNLIQNALQYTEKGKILITLKTESHQALVLVQDTGIGIPSHKINRIFERFYVADKSRSRQVGGTGLGLSIVKHIVELHGGSISVQSVPGEGSCFSFSLPLRG